MKKLIPLALVLTTPAFAADEAKKWSGEGELGYTMTSSAAGTEGESLLGKLGINYKNAAWGNEFKLEQIKGSTTDVNGDKTDSADRSTLTNKVTYDFNADFFSWAAGKYEDDEFSDYHYIQNLTAGLGWHVIKNDTTLLDLEAGAGSQRLTLRNTGDTESGVAFRFLEKFSHKLNENTDFTQSLLAEGNDDNIQTTLDLGLKVAMSKAVALKLSHQVKHNSEVEPGTSNYDRISSVAVVYGF